MYNKLFGKILDSSIWLENDHTRLVWITLLATMDEDGFCQYASIGNLAHRAVVPIKKCETAVGVLEAPDGNSSDPEFDGRRVERVPGGWMVLNAKKYQALATRERVREMVRERVRKHRANKKGNAGVTPCNQVVTPSDTDTDTCGNKGEPLSFARGVMEKLGIPGSRIMLESVAVAIANRIKETGNPIEAECNFICAQFENWRASANYKRMTGNRPLNWFNGAHYNDDPDSWKEVGNGQRKSARDERDAGRQFLRQQVPSGNPV